MTGYTSFLMNKDTTFRDAVLRFARLSSFCIHQRDEPIENLPTKRTIDLWYKSSLDDAKKRLADFKNMPLEKLKSEFDSQKTKRIHESQICIKDKNKLKDDYEFRMKQIRDWMPPSSEHTSLKDSIISHIESSMITDCDTEYYVNTIKFYENLSFDVWYKETMDSYEHDVIYYEERCKENEEHVKIQNKWIDDLMESLENK